MRQQDGVWVLDFASKTAAGERSVPIHKGLIDRGFLDFARSRGAGYLFFDERHLRRGATAKPGKSAANDVREWIGGLGLNVGMEHRTAPAHGFRHMFMTLARKVGMDAEKREYMVGHELGGERGTYGAMAGLAVESPSFPIRLHSLSPPATRGLRPLPFLPPPHTIHPCRFLSRDVFSRTAADTTWTLTTSPASWASTPSLEACTSQRCRRPQASKLYFLKHVFSRCYQSSLPCHGPSF